MSDVQDRLSSCGACEGVESITPEPLRNRPGLTQLNYRVGTHGTFKETMLRNLSKHPALRQLLTREDRDATVALIDSWSVVLDVLTFYQERHIQENFLRTATERRSVLALARSIGYELRAGVAASTELVFSMQEAEGAPQSALLRVGTKAQTIPGQDELPQTFETVEELESHVELNALLPRQTRPTLIAFGSTQVHLAGTGNQLQPGDVLLFVGQERENDPTSERWDVRLVQEVEIKHDQTFNQQLGWTRITWDRGLGSVFPHVDPAANPKIYVLRRRTGIFGHNAPDWRFIPTEMKLTYCGLSATATLPADKRDEWPDFTIYSPAPSSGKTPGGVELDEQRKQVDLDSVHQDIVPQSWLVLSAPHYRELYKVLEVSEASRNQFSLTGKTTRVTLEGENYDEFEEALRSITVYAVNELLEVIEEPVDDPVNGDSIVLNRKVERLTEEQLVILSGTLESTEEPFSELVQVKSLDEVEGLTRVNLERSIQSYQRKDFKLQGNVARATHGETKQEVLGSGDASRKFQEFILGNRPLTYVSAAVPSGEVSTLEIRIDNILWKEIESLYEAGPRDKVYALRHANDGTTTVQFGDGVTGARLPTGENNVTAKYRVETGLPGMVKAGQISMLMSQPAGVKSVINPLAPAGAADPESLEEARENAPTTVLTFDRIVSLRDYEDFARAFLGIAKAQSAWLWNGNRRLLHLTVAGSLGLSVEPTSQTYIDLVEAIDGARHADQPVKVETYESRTFRMRVELLINPDHLDEVVLGSVTSVLLETFGFEARSFGQDVTLGEVMSVCQQVEGVVAVDVIHLYFSNGSEGRGMRLASHQAHWDGGVHPAQLLTIDPDGIELEKVTS